MTKVFILPTYSGPDKADGGIRRVIEAMHHHLPRFGVEVVDNVDDADVVNYHAGNYTPHPNKPLVASCHGLYWTDYNWPDQGYYNVNRQVIEVMSRADAVTVPSDWVNKAISRHTMYNPITVYHGVNSNEWKIEGSKGPQNYVLWNKARADVVSNPVDLQTIAEKMHDTLFFSTIGQGTRNLEVFGVVNYPQMKKIIAAAGVYLCTARETFGIGTLEAMAAGVPVAGWAYGGQEEIIKNGYTGYLAPYGDYEKLAECIRRCFAEREKLSQNCVNDILERWQWLDKIEQYAKIFKHVHHEHTKERPKISVIVPCHNLGKYLPNALDSVKSQTEKGWECLIIDDASTDNTAEIALNYTKDDNRFTLVGTDDNIGLCQARNLGVSASNGRYINFLDADDILTPNALETLSKPLDESPEIHISYGRLGIMNHDATKTREGGVNDFNFYDQLAHLHQFPIGGSLIRRRVLENSGGFRVRDWRAEDAAWVARIVSFGFRPSKVTDETMMYWRARHDSKSMIESRKHKDVDGDWTSWLGWRVGAHNAKLGRELRAKGIGTPPEATPAGALVNAKPAGGAQFNTSHNQEPLVSVIIPVGPNHTHLLIDALDSLYAQTMQNWEAIVVNDSGKSLNIPQWATLIETSGQEGAGVARNMGIKAARGDLVLFLDADDWLLSNCLEVMLGAFHDMEGSKYIYSDYLALDNSGGLKHEKMKPYNQHEWKGQHAVNILIDKKWLFDVGLFDEKMGGWEDWDLPLKLAINGYCGYHINTPCFVYRKFAGKRREWAFDNGHELLSILNSRYEPYYREVNKMNKKSCCGGNVNASALVRYRESLNGRTAVQGLMENKNTVSNTRMEFTGGEQGAITFKRIGGTKLQRIYRGSAKPSNKYINAHPQDVGLLESTGKWRIVSRQITQTGTGRTIGMNVDPPPISPPPPVEQNTEHEPPEIKEILITPKAASILDESGINPAYVSGTGKDGKITVMDARNAVKELVP